MMTRRKLEEGELLVGLTSAAQIPRADGGEATLPLPYSVSRLVAASFREAVGRKSRSGAHSTHAVRRIEVFVAERRGANSST